MIIKSGKTTIRDIARQAMVSEGTVDRVIHDRRGVSEKARKRILRIIRELDYQPDILARTLATKKSFHIAALYPGLKSGSLFWNLPEKGMNRAISEIKHFGLELVKYLFDQANPDSFEKQAAKVISAAPDGIILAPVFAREARIFSRLCFKMKIPFVYINSHIAGQQNLSFIGQDSVASGKVAARLMHQCLHSGDKIAVINIARDLDNQLHILQREKGFRNYLTKTFGIANNIISSLTLMDTGGPAINRALDRFFSSHKETKGVFVTNSRVYKVSEWMVSRKSDPFILIGYDLLPQSRKYLEEGIITFLISQKPEEQGYRGVMNLFRYLVMKNEVPKNQYLPIDILTKENIQYY
jgi:LacI family transcriptional regulator